MWPWEHLAFGYLAYSASRRLVTGKPPRSDAVVVLGLATQLPDLVDKPLAWTLSILPSGHSLAHSLLTALPLSAVALVLAHRARRTDIGVAFTVGYLSHLAGDIIYPIAVGKDPAPGFLLWPVVSVPPDQSSLGFLARFRSYFGDYLTYLNNPEIQSYLALELGLLSVVFFLWLVDGMPGVPRKIVRYAPVIGR
ncbi:LexA-binding, inner membrane-associated putative hydrolase [Haladaptatus litoreus]|uniref:LexA-binding, inner membrane-associated putative hydrolase n=1 Tax=Haladaptatus litoreus TaxID=553468 RepID=A0A1N6YYX1_9EURY|nr:metal-dependent hydrolase [Haladaptatus litoreus]SIR19746.1 LexA-binding, inner membrane-associated putative hydrolase [Haladaptatus litoreus]